MDAYRAQLDALMGKDRNMHAPTFTQSSHTRSSDQKKEAEARKPHYSDRKVCRQYLMGMCTHDLFRNTRSDQGPCLKLHDEDIKRHFDQSPNKHKWFDHFEREWISVLEGLVAQVDARVQVGLKRKEETLRIVEQGGSNVMNVTQDNAARVNSLTEQISTLSKEMESMVEDGNVDAAGELMREIDRLKSQKEVILRTNTRTGILEQEKKMQVCDICGAYQAENEADSRVNFHLAGKQHTGFSRIRDIIADYYLKIEERKKVKEEEAKKRGPEGNEDGDTKRRRDH